MLWCAARKNQNAFPMSHGFIGFSWFYHFMTWADKWTHSGRGALILWSVKHTPSYCKDLGCWRCCMSPLLPSSGFGPSNWSCLLYSKGVQHYFVCLVGEAVGSRISLHPAEHESYCVLALRVGEWVRWLRGAASHSITVSQQGVKGKSWLTGGFKFFEGVTSMWQRVTQLT